MPGPVRSWPGSAFTSSRVDEGIATLSAPVRAPDDPVDRPQQSVLRNRQDPSIFRGELTEHSPTDPMDPIRLRQLGERLAPHLLPLLLFAGLTPLFLHSFVCLWNLGAAPVEGSDPGLVMWTISWVNHALLNQASDLFAANAFYPYAGSLSYSEHAFGVAILVSPWYWFSDNPVIPYNLLLLFCYFGSAAGMYCLAYYYTGSRWAAFISGSIFGFAFFRTHHFGHLTLICTAWFPLSVWALHRLRDRFTWGLGAVWVAVTALQCLGNWYVAVMLALTLGLVTLFESLRRPRPWPFLLRLAPLVAAIGLILLPFARPYVSHPVDRDLAEGASFSADVSSYVDPPWNTLLGQALQNRDRWIWGEKTLYLGFISMLLAVAGIVWNRRNGLAWFYLGLAGLGFLLSLGPRTEGGLLLPLALVYKLVPVLGQFRATARFALLVVFALSLLAGLAAARLKGRPLLLSVLAGAALLEIFPVGLGFDACATAPFAPRPVDVWLKSRNPAPVGWPGDRQPRQRERKVVLELPDYSGTDKWPRESLYMLYSTQHWMNLVNGYTRFYPPGYASDFQQYERFPDRESIAFMRRRGIDFVVVHLSALEEGRRSAVLQAPGLVKRFGDDCVFDLASPEVARFREAPVRSESTIGVRDGSQDPG